MYCVSGLWFGWKAVLRQALAVAEECKRKPLRLSKCDCYRTSLCGSILLLRKFLYSFLIPGNQIPLELYLRAITCDKVFHSRAL
jgi:hypothetical protein